MTDDSVTYIEEIEAWRRKVDASLRREEGWLALVGLHWLKPGVNRAGAGPGRDIALPAESVTGDFGAFLVEQGRVLFEAAPGAAVTCEGEPVTEVELQPDTTGSPTRLRWGRITLALIRRGGRLGIRVWDREAPARRSFPGRQWFPVDLRFRMAAAYEAYPTPRPVLAPDISGGVQTMESPGEVTFSLLRKQLRLVASEEEEGALFLIFADATAGASTYPAGRYLYTSPRTGGAIEIDFNRAYNPPCAFTPYATCPLPPPENRLPLPIEAGERYSPAGG
ncbi:MAG: hypothetical protein A2Y93_09375 [Chloroflexi bacterium RBG_13_68_17]|nr:MAG: hypothetical protein A2Y93_09375 [Chloroflexi bacterium RBG_13_68_17]